MEYSRNLKRSYALRAIQNFKSVKEGVLYEFTFITTTLLAVLTTINPEDNDFEIDVESINDLPFVEEFCSRKEYFKLIRNALAHKTDDNFADIKTNHNISRIRMSSRGNDYIEMNLDDLNIILNKLEFQLIEEYSVFDVLRSELENSIDEIIPKPRTNSHVIKGLGIRRDEEAIIYKIKDAHEKGISRSEMDTAFRYLYRNGSLTRSEFERILPKCASEGGCNYTSIGGIFQMHNIATYEENIYRYSSFYFV